LSWKELEEMGKEDVREVAVLKAHVALNVRNVVESTEFYRKMLGLEPSKVRAGYAKFNVENPPLNLTLNQVAFGERGALSHMGLQVSSSEDVLTMRERWQAAGLSTREEMQTNCCYAVQDKTWVQDPDGNQWEAFVVLEDNLTESSACCTTAVNEQSEVEAAPACSTENVAGAEASGCCTPSAAPVSISR
jgi:catechol 2,3-dioxygenase-like lactoylglutathione lyase family enzyme